MLNAIPLVHAIARVVPSNRWVPITFIEQALHVHGRTATRDEVHCAAAQAALRHLIARRRRPNRTHQFRRQPFTWDSPRHAAPGTRPDAAHQPPQPQPPEGAP